MSMAKLNRFAKEIISEDKEYLKLYSQTRCEIEYRLLKAYKNFFRRLKENKNGKRQKVGFPRFKSRDRYKSITYPQDNGSFSIEKDRLRISRIGTMKIELHRKLDGTIKIMTVKREAKEYYAIFTSIVETKIQERSDTNPIGIDVGLTSFITTSEGKKFTKPKFQQERKKKLARWQRIIARRKKGSKNREKAKLKLQKEWKHINNRSDDYLHKLSRKLVESKNTSFVVEKLDIRSMVKNHNLARSINNASWNKFKQLLSYKAESAGLKVVEVDARNTSKECSKCGAINEVALSDRIYVCCACGLRMDRDINAAINILHRATTAGLAGSNACENLVTTHPEMDVQTRSMKQEHTPKVHSISGGSLGL